MNRYEEKLSLGNTVEADRKRRDRVPIHESRNLLTVEEDPRYQYRWVRDYPAGNVSRFLRAGYEFVIDESIEVGDVAIDGQRAVGGVVSKMGDPKHGTMLYLMRILKELYIEDQDAKQKQLDEIDKQLYAQANKEGFYGKTTVSRDKTIEAEETLKLRK